MAESYRKGTGTKNKETYHCITASEAFKIQGNDILATWIPRSVYKDANYYENSKLRKIKKKKKDYIW